MIHGADVFIGVSGPGVLKVEDIAKMSADPIVFVMANPEPEIDPEAAESLVRMLATGRSDFPNQINNVLCFQGIFRGRQSGIKEVGLALVVCRALLYDKARI